MYTYQRMSINMHLFIYLFYISLSCDIFIPARPPQSPATHTGLGDVSMKVEYHQGAPPLVEPFTHTKLHTQVLGSIPTLRRVYIYARYNRHCSWSYTPTALVWAALSCCDAKGQRDCSTRFLGVVFSMKLPLLVLLDYV